MPNMRQGYVVSGLVEIERVRAAIRLIGDDHITPMGRRILESALVPVEPDPQICHLRVRRLLADGRTAHIACDEPVSHAYRASKNVIDVTCQACLLNAPDP